MKRALLSLVVITSCVIGYMQCTITTSAQSRKPNMFDNEISMWHDVINAIIKVESGGDSLAVSPSGRYVGAMQIGKVVVDDCNEFAKMKRIKVQYNYDDRYSLRKSKEMFVLIQQRYNKGANVERAIKIWNGGCGYKRTDTKVITYYNKVMKHLCVTR